MGASLLLDIGPLSHDCTDHALEAIYKSAAEQPPEATIWAPHHDPYVRDHVEAVTARGQSILVNILNDVLGRLGGEPVADLRKSLLAKAQEWLRWDAAELRRVKARLERRKPADYTLDDWLLLVDWIVQKHLPADVIRTEAEYLAVRAAMAGKLQAAMNEPLPGPELERMLGLLPTSMALLRQGVPVSSMERLAVEFAAARAGELITDIGDRARHSIKQLILEHEQGRAMGSPDATLWKLQQSMLDNFATLNRDWRRIAITETARDANEGFIAALPPGSKVRRVEAYPTACPFCRSIHGKEFAVVSPDAPEKDGARQVWVGKTNIGRSASPRKREGDALVERTPDELWWPAAGTQHPHCFVSPLVPIYTDSGWRPISSIKAGDMVLTHKGRFRPVNWVLKGAKHDGPVISIWLSDAGEHGLLVPRMTPEHPVLTKRGWLPAGDVGLSDRIIAFKGLDGADDYVTGDVGIRSIHRNNVSGAILYNFGVEEDESYVISGGVVVHNCRGTWSLVRQPPAGANKDFLAWMERELATVKP